MQPNVTTLTGNPTQSAYAAAQPASGVATRFGNAIPPGFYVGPRHYNAYGVVPHPLQLTAQFYNPAGQPAVKTRAGVGPFAQQFGATVAPGITMGWPFPYTINGRQPG